VRLTRPDSLDFSAIPGSAPTGPAVHPAPIQRCGIGSSCDCGPAEKVSALRHDVQRVTEQSGSTIPEQTRKQMEKTFRADFSAVRIHTGKDAHDIAATLSAQALTSGNSILFQDGLFRPGTSSGDRILAHELTHVVQQRRGAPHAPIDQGPADPLEVAAATAADHAARGVPVPPPLTTGRDHPGVQRFTSCTQARLSLEECPRRQPGEYAHSRGEPMTVDYVLSPEAGFVVSNFTIGQSELKAGVKSSESWNQLVKAVSEKDSRWEILGLSDCEGPDTVNTAVRRRRAAAVHAALPAAAQAHIDRADGASLTDCLTDNTTEADRAFNRSVVVRPLERRFDFPPVEIEGHRPVPKPETQPTVDCTDTQDRQIGQAHPIAEAMVRRAIYVLGDPATPALRALLVRYFNNSSEDTQRHVLAGLQRTLSGLRHDVKFECEQRGSFLYDWACPRKGTTVTTGYVYGYVGFRVHLCEEGFDQNDIGLATTLVHELSHMWDYTDDKEYCQGGCGPSLTPEDALDNADSYARFASDVYLRL
jgi:outer membrane protein OmpA-like peptidoglycan-associated protein